MTIRACSGEVGRATACCGPVRRGTASQGVASLGLARFGKVMSGSAWRGKAMQAGVSRVLVRSGMPRQGTNVRLARQDLKTAKVRSGLARWAWACRDTVRRCEAGSAEAWRGIPRFGKVGRGDPGFASVSCGNPSRGEEWQGKPVQGGAMSALVR